MNTTLVKARPEDVTYHEVNPILATKHTENTIYCEVNPVLVAKQVECTLEPRKWLHTDFVVPEPFGERR